MTVFWDHADVLTESFYIVGPATEKVRQPWVGYKASNMVLPAGDWQQSEDAVLKQQQRLVYSMPSDTNVIKCN